MAYGFGSGVYFVNTGITTITSTSTAEAGTEGVRGEDGRCIVGKDIGCVC